MSKIKVNEIDSQSGGDITIHQNLVFASGKGFTSEINEIGTPGGQGFGVGICPELPVGFSALNGYDDVTSDNYGNYMYQDGSICVWIPKFYYKIESDNSIDIVGEAAYTSTAEAEAAGYALHRAFIDGGAEQRGFFRDKYTNSKITWGSGYIASSIKDGLPISTAAAHNPIAGLTACSANAHHEALVAPKARDGVDGAVGTSSNWFCSSVFIEDALAKISLAHAQASSTTNYCEWYDSTHNYPKGCNDNALGDTDDSEIAYVTDGYSNAGKAGSGTPFARTTHNGQANGVCDVNGNMYRIVIGMTCVATEDAAIEAMASNASVTDVTWTGHGLSTGDWVMFESITQADWTNLNDKLWKITSINANSFSVDLDSSGYAVYDDGVDPGTYTKGAFYLAKQSISMTNFTSGDADATDHWGATGVAAMMDEVTTMPFVDGGALTQRFGSGSNQVFSAATASSDAEDWALSGAGMPKDEDGVDGTGTDEFGKDYFYQKIVDESCVLAGGYWLHASCAGVFNRFLDHYRASSGDAVGLAAACYL